jgi:hypothetical protein
VCLCVSLGSSLLIFVVDKIHELNQEQLQWRDMLLAMHSEMDDSNCVLAIFETKTPRSFGLPRSMKTEDRGDLVYMPVYSAKYGASLSAVVSDVSWDALWAGEVTVSITPTVAGEKGFLGLLPDWYAFGYYPSQYVEWTDHADLYVTMHDRVVGMRSSIDNWSPLLQQVLGSASLLSTFHVECEKKVSKYSRDLLIKTETDLATSKTRRIHLTGHDHAQQFSDVVDILQHGSAEWKN